eukprot:11878801-Alexandrium_andersonii.AAC.1
MRARKGPPSVPARPGVGQVVLVDHSPAGGVPPTAPWEGNPPRTHHAVSYTHLRAHETSAHL